MKRITFALLLVLFLVTGNTATAQDNWVQGKKGIYSIGVGATSHWYFNRFTGLGNGLSLNFSGEYKVWDWVGVGFQTGLNFYWWGTYRYGGGAFGIPVGAKANAHILDAANVSIADKLDVYAGINLGFGPAFGSRGATVFFYGGPQVGVRYWLGTVAVFGEIGYGATFANIGVTF